jgi:hypothetical protein
MRTHRGCTIKPESGTPIYFGHEYDRNGYDQEGYRTDWQKVTFPDNTWIRCPTVEESIKYINSYLSLETE